MANLKRSLISMLERPYRAVVGFIYRMLDRKTVAAARDLLGPSRIMGDDTLASQRALNPRQVIIGGSGILVGERGVRMKLFGRRIIWFGDLDLTSYMDNLVALSRLAGDTLYILNEKRQTIAKIRSVGDENEIKVFPPGIALDANGRYLYSSNVAAFMNRAEAKRLLEQRGWLPANLVEFYGLKPTKKRSRAKSRA
jgi:hypothetical protein